MNNHFSWTGWLCLLVVFLGLTTGCQQQENSLRIMSYNIRNLRGMDDVRDVGRIARVINETKPNVVAVQEVDSVTGRSEQTDVLGLLATETQIHPTYAAAIDYDGGKYGVGILSKEQPMSYYSIPLPGREEQRVLLVVEFDRYLFACTHLSLTEEDRLRSLPLLNQETAKANKPLFIAGDWNATPNSSFIGELRQSFTLLSDPEQLTFPADTPNCTLDYVAIYGTDTLPVNVKRTQVVDEPMASDHRPVVVELTLTAK